MSHPKPYKVITVSTTPDRASRMVRRLAEDVKDRYMIIHCVNVSKIEDVESRVTLYRPDILTRRQFCASTWSPDQSAEIKRIARGIVPGLRCYVIPPRMQVEKDSVATIEHIKAQLPMIIEGNLGLQD
ncbi:hypothetical protein CLCR_10893 [Cladophialophora carrionii]|uniref:Uncharacterized protein n=1 Tax=Cladophialophora carrionii TaxID=86049 RepID=A0A1C1CZR8_9EURO|nr:hypothetical protein CLCR_10893 [Cladophialophora carrionii]